MTETILQEAHRLTNGDRNDQYGHPLDDFSKTALYWTAHLRARGLLVEGAELDPEDVGWMMVDVKRSRAANSPDNRDHYVDGAGYVGTVHMIREERGRRGPRGPKRIDLS